ncbi:MAG: ECF-type sigma factor, partial [Planctomycetota bacterium]
TPAITRLLQALRHSELESETANEAGRAEAAEDLARAVHTKLERIARCEFKKAGAGALTIEPGVLADDALLKILGNSSTFENRRVFFAYATRIMVRELLNHQRLRRAQKRGGDWVRVTLTSAKEAEPGLAVDIEHMPEILDELRQLDARKADVVELKVFWGMTVPEIAETLDVSASTVDREWRFAQRWLARELRHKVDMA